MIKCTDAGYLLSLYLYYINAGYLQGLYLYFRQGKMRFRLLFPTFHFFKKNSFPSLNWL